MLLTPLLEAGEPKGAELQSPSWLRIVLFISPVGFKGNLSLLIDFVVFFCGGLEQMEVNCKFIVVGDSRV